MALRPAAIRQGWLPINEPHTQRTRRLIVGITGRQILALTDVSRQRTTAARVPQQAVVAPKAEARP
jgi:hypothetical protein